MSPGHCSCPDCGTILRIRDRSFVGRKIDCPECHAELLIEVDEHQALFARRPPTEQKPRPAPPLVVAASKAHVALVRRLGDAARSPLILAWALAIGVTAFFAILMLRPTVRFLPAAPSPSRETAVTESSQPPDSNEEVPSSPEEAPVKDSVTPPPVGPMSENPPSLKPAVEPTPQPKVIDPPAVTSEPNVVVAPPATTVTPSKVPPPPPKKIDVVSKLKQPLDSFKQPSVSRRRLIEQVDEMLDAPIHYDADELGARNLDKLVTVELEKTTVGGVLKAVLDGAGWESVIEDDGLRLKPRQAAVPPMP